MRPEGGERPVSERVHPASSPGRGHVTGWPWGALAPRHLTRASWSCGRATLAQPSPRGASAGAPPPAVLRTSPSGWRPPPARHTPLPSRLRDRGALPRGLAHSGSPRLQLVLVQRVCTAERPRPHSPPALCRRGPPPAPHSPAPPGWCSGTDRTPRALVGPLQLGRSRSVRSCGRFVEG